MEKYQSKCELCANPSRDEGEEEAPEAISGDRDETGRVSSRSGEHSSRVQGGTGQQPCDTPRIERRNWRGIHWKGLELGFNRD